VESELSALGFPVIAISPDRPAEMQKSLEAKGLGYALYSDSSLEAARAFGIVFQLDDEQVAEYAGYGIDLEAASGQAHHQLPVPSVFLVEAGGTIRWIHSDPDYSVRPDNETLLQAARGFAGEAPPE
jgi:peroxiredoxin